MIIPLLVLAGLGAAAAVVVASQKTVSQGALPGCVFSPRLIDSWGKLNGLAIVVAPENPTDVGDGYLLGASHEGAPILYWQEGSRVFMVKTTDGDYVADWHAVDSYCRYDLSRPRNDSRSHRTS